MAVYSIVVHHLYIYARGSSNSSDYKRTQDLCILFCIYNTYRRTARDRSTVVVEEEIERNKNKKNKEANFLAADADGKC